jgi:hypothetical protein
MSSQLLTSASEVAILSRIIQPHQPNLSAAAARAWLKLDFQEQDRERKHALASKAQEGNLTVKEEAELEN